MTKTSNTVISIIANQLSIPLERIKPTDNIVLLGADSLDMVEIIMAIEDQYGIEVPDMDWERVVTVKDAVDLVGRMLKE